MSEDFPAVIKGIRAHHETLHTAFMNVEERLGAGETCDLEKHEDRKLYNNYAFHTNEALKTLRVLQDLLTKGEQE